LGKVGRREGGEQAGRQTEVSIMFGLHLLGEKFIHIVFIWLSWIDEGVRRSLVGWLDFVRHGLWREVGFLIWSGADTAKKESKGGEGGFDRSSPLRVIACMERKNEKVVDE